MSQLQRLVIASEQLNNDSILLTTSQQHYLRQVLRLQESDRFIAVDRTGRWLLSQLTESSDQATIIEELDGDTELPVAVKLIIAMPKQGMDDIVRHCTELGVTTIQPVISDRTILKPSLQKVERWQRIAEEAAEQSERRFVPQVLTPESFGSMLTQWTVNSQAIDPNPTLSANQDIHQLPVPKAYLCAARHDAPHLQHVLSQQRLMQSNGRPDMVVAIGPEGGWTPDEITRAIAHGFQIVSLGRRILRAVTAPTVALSIIASVVECDVVPSS
ncbi:MAG: 16S rRNA (uracil(1498)-N(3))-methyltransferase [Cyanobacteria bacterium J06633_2]